MALFRACTNPQATLKLEAAYRKLPTILPLGPPTDKPAEPLKLRRGAIREAVIVVLAQADQALAPLEVRRRAAHRLGRPVRRHTIDTFLAKLVADPAAPVTKVGPAQYANVDPAIRVCPDSQMSAIQERVLDVLRTASVAVRPAEIWAAIEAQHGDAMSYDAVASFLSLAAKYPDLPVERVKRVGIA